MNKQEPHCAIKSSLYVSRLKDHQLNFEAVLAHFQKHFVLKYEMSLLPIDPRQLTTEVRALAESIDMLAKDIAEDLALIGLEELAGRLQKVQRVIMYLLRFSAQKMTDVYEKYGSSQQTGELSASKRRLCDGCSQNIETLKLKSLEKINVNAVNSKKNYTETRRQQEREKQATEQREKREYERQIKESDVTQFITTEYDQFIDAVNSLLMNKQVVETRKASDVEKVLKTVMVAFSDSGEKKYYFEDAKEGVYTKLYQNGAQVVSSVSLQMVERLKQLFFKDFYSYCCSLGLKLAQKSKDLAKSLMHSKEVQTVDLKSGESMKFLQTRLQNMSKEVDQKSNRVKDLQREKLTLMMNIKSLELNLEEQTARCGALRREVEDNQRDKIESMNSLMRMKEVEQIQSQVTLRNIQSKTEFLEEQNLRLQREIFDLKNKEKEKTTRFTQAVMEVAHVGIGCMNFWTEKMKYNEDKIVKYQKMLKELGNAKVVREEQEKEQLVMRQAELEQEVPDVQMASIPDLTPEELGEEKPVQLLPRADRKRSKKMTRVGNTMRVKFQKKEPSRYQQKKEQKEKPKPKPVVKAQPGKPKQQIRHSVTSGNFGRIANIQQSESEFAVEEEQQPEVVKAQSEGRLPTESEPEVQGQADPVPVEKQEERREDHRKILLQDINTKSMKKVQNNISCMRKSMSKKLFSSQDSKVRHQTAFVHRRDSGLQTREVEPHKDQPRHKEQLVQFITQHRQLIASLRLEEQIRQLVLSRGRSAFAAQIRAASPLSPFQSNQGQVQTELGESGDLKPLRLQQLKPHIIVKNSTILDRIKKIINKEPNLSRKTILQNAAQTERTVQARPNFWGKAPSCALHYSIFRELDGVTYSKAENVRKRDSSKILKSKRGKVIGGSGLFDIEDLELFGGVSEAYAFQYLSRKNGNKSHNKHLQAEQISEQERQVAVKVHEYLMRLKAKNLKKFLQIKSFLKFPFQSCVYKMDIMDVTCDLTQEHFLRLFSALISLHRRCSNCSHFDSFLAKIGYSVAQM